MLCFLLIILKITIKNGKRINAHFFIEKKEALKVLKEYEDATEMHGYPKTFIQQIDVKTH